jgi:hypothetical protein
LFLVRYPKGFIVPPLSGSVGLDGQKHPMVVGAGRASPNPGGGSGAFKEVGIRVCCEMRFDIILVAAVVEEVWMIHARR